MKQKRITDPSLRSTRNFVLLVILTVALPSLLLTGFGVIAINNEEIAARKRLESLYRPIMEQVAARFNGQLDRLPMQGDAPLAALAEWASQLAEPVPPVLAEFHRLGFTTNYFVIEADAAGQGRIWLPLEHGAALDRSRQVALEEALQRASRASTDPAARVAALTGLPAWLGDPAAASHSGAEVELGARRALELLAGVKGYQAVALREWLEAIASRNKVTIAVRQAHPRLEPGVRLTVVRVEGVRRVFLVRGGGRLAGCELIPQGFAPLLNGVLTELGLTQEVEVRLQRTEGPCCVGEQTLAAEALLKKTDLAWLLTLVLVSDDAVQGLARGRSTLYSWVLLLLVLALVAGIFRTVQLMLRETRLSRLKTDFVSTVSHELRTPLTSIRMFTETLLLGRTESREEELECLQVIEQETERLTRLTERILDFSRMEAGRKAYHLRLEPPAELVRSAVASCRPMLTEGGFELTQQVGEGLPSVAVDRDAIIEVLINLLTNAIKYSPDDRRVTLGARRADPWLELWVTDHGLGIPRAEQQKIFEKFYRVDDPRTLAVPGSGLGLSLVDYIVRAHRGEIRVDSQPGRGSTFTVRLPLPQGGVEEG